MSKINLVPIKVILKKRDNGQVAWPNFNEIDSEIRRGQPWSHFIDNHGIGWHYDKVENLGTGAESGCAATLIPKEFADAAVGLFPELVSIVGEAEFELFYDERVTVDQPIEFLDTEMLQGIAARVQLEENGIAPAPSNEITAARAKCLDPKEQNHRGIRKNMKKKWSDVKKELKVELHPNSQK